MKKWVLFALIMCAVAGTVAFIYDRDSDIRITISGKQYCLPKENRREAAGGLWASLATQDLPEGNSIPFRLTLAEGGAWKTVNIAGLLSSPSRYSGLTNPQVGSRYWRILNAPDMPHTSFGGGYFSTSVPGEEQYLELIWEASENGRKILAACRKGSKVQSLSAAECDRAISLEDFSILYYMPRSLIGNAKQIDTEIVRQVKGWECRATSSE